MQKYTHQLRRSRHHLILVHIFYALLSPLTRVWPFPDTTRECLSISLPRFHHRARDTTPPKLSYCQSTFFASFSTSCAISLRSLRAFFFVIFLWRLNSVEVHRWQNRQSKPRWHPSRVYIKQQGIHSPGEWFLLPTEGSSVGSPSSLSLPSMQPLSPVVALVGDSHGRPLWGRSLLKACAGYRKRAPPLAARGMSKPGGYRNGIFIADFICILSQSRLPPPRVCERG